LLTSIGKRILIGSGITLLSLIISRAMVFLNNIIAARLLTPNDFGTLSIVMNLQNLAVIIGCFGAPLAMTRYVSHWRNRDISIARAFGSLLLYVTLISSFATAIGFLLISSTIASQLYGVPGMTMVLRLSAAFIILSSLNLVLSSLLQGNQKIKTLAKINALVAITWQPVALISIAVLGVEGAVLAMILSNFISVLVLVLVSRDFLLMNFSHSLAKTKLKRERGLFFSFLVPAFLSSLVIAPAYWIGRTILAIDWNFYLLGQYSVAESLSQIMLVIPAAVSIPLLPLLTEQHSINPLEMGKITERLIKIVVLLMLPLTLFLFPFLSIAINFLYGESYSAAFYPAILMFAASALASVGSIVSNVIFGIGRMWHALILNLFWVIVYISFVIVIVPSQGSIGLASVYLISYALYVIAFLLYFKREIGIKPFGSIITILLYSGFAFFFLTIISDRKWMVYATPIAIIFAIILGITIYRFLLTTEDRNYVKRLLTNRI